MVWKGASTKTLLEVLVLELGLTAQCTVGGRAQHTVAHLLPVTHRQLQWRSRSQLLRSITDEGRAKWQLMPRSRTRLPEPRTASVAESRRTSLRSGRERVKNICGAANLMAMRRLTPASQLQAKAAASGYAIGTSDSTPARMYSSAGRSPGITRARPAASHVTPPYTVLLQAFA